MSIRCVRRIGEKASRAINGVVRDLESREKKNRTLLKLCKASLKRTIWNARAVLPGLLNEHRLEWPFHEIRRVLMPDFPSTVFPGSSFRDMKGKGKLPPFVIQPFFRACEDLFGDVHGLLVRCSGN
jgi:hypothetical protein